MKKINTSILIPASLLFSLVLVLMIPISDAASAAKPKFDNTTLGKGCSTLWDKIKELRDRRTQQGGVLDQTDSSELGNAESNYKSICAGIYGSLPLVVSNPPQSPTVEENVDVDKPQQQDNQEPGKISEDKPQQQDNQNKRPYCNIGWGIC